MKSKQLIFETTEEKKEKFKNAIGGIGYKQAFTILMDMVIDGEITPKQLAARLIKMKKDK